jgi:hypothetical protein
MHIPMYFFLQWKICIGMQPPTAVSIQRETSTSTDGLWIPDEVGYLRHHASIYKRCLDSCKSSSHFHHSTCPFTHCTVLHCYTALHLPGLDTGKHRFWLSCNKQECEDFVESAVQGFSLFFRMCYKRAAPMLLLLVGRIHIPMYFFLQWKICIGMQQLSLFSMRPALRWMACGFRRRLDI